jgi:hypothetical protein
MKWYVWCRVLHTPLETGRWWDTPKQYKNKRAAHRAVADLTKDWNSGDRHGTRFQFFACPEGMTPRKDTIYIPKELK